jgi:hypothetical protein
MNLYKIMWFFGDFQCQSKPHELWVFLGCPIALGVGSRRWETEGEWEGFGSRIPSQLVGYLCEIFIAKSLTLSLRRSPWTLVIRGFRSITVQRVHSRVSTTVGLCMPAPTTLTPPTNPTLGQSLAVTVAAENKMKLMTRDPGFLLHQESLY